MLFQHHSIALLLNWRHNGVCVCVCVLHAKNGGAADAGLNSIHLQYIIY